MDSTEKAFLLWLFGCRDARLENIGDAGAEAESLPKVVADAEDNSGRSLSE